MKCVSARRSDPRRGRIVAYLVPAVVLLVTLLVAANIVSSGGSSRSSAVLLTRRAGPYTVTLRLKPDRPGPNTIAVVVQGDTRTNPAAKARVIESMVTMNMGTLYVELSRVGADSFGGKTFLPMAGQWQLEVLVAARSGRTYASAFRAGIGT